MMQQDLSLFRRFCYQTDIVCEGNRDQSPTLRVKRHRPMWSLDGERALEGKQLVIDLNTPQVDAISLLGG